MMRSIERDDPLRRARHSIGKGEFREAAELLAEVRERMSDSPEWMLLMAMASSVRRNRKRIWKYFCRSYKKICA